MGYISALFFVLYQLSLSWMDHLAPHRDHRELAWTNALVVMSSEPLFRDDRIRTLSLIVAIQYRESGFVMRAVGDNGESFCAMQIHSSIGGNSSLLTSPEACVRKGYAFLRQSISVDRDHPVAFYARGGNYRSDEAKRIDRDRMNLARSLLADPAQ